MSTVDGRALLDDSTSSAYSSVSDDELQPATLLTPRNRRLLIGSAVVLFFVVALALILDYAIFVHEGDDAPGCALPEFAAFANLSSIPLLPDPFLLPDGTRATTKAQWQCSRQLLSANLQHWELGTRPPPPAYVSSALLPNNSGMTIYAGHDSSTAVNFTVSFQLPAVGSAPYPAMLALGGRTTLNATQLLSLGVAIVGFVPDVIAAQMGMQTRGVGLFYSLYGSNHSAGALIAWSWAAGLILDQLANSGQQLIDATRVGVTGCSRLGKGALVIGAFDERFALTVPQESGSGGIANWRISDWQGTATQTLGQIVGENPWFGAALAQFRGSTAKLPVDHHSLIALVAPRGLLTIDNPSMVWLGNISSWGGALAGRLVYQALGAEDSMGISDLGDHNHCALPYAQNGEVERYVRRFLLHEAGVNTTVLYSDRQYPEFNLSSWVDWSVPVLS